MVQVPLPPVYTELDEAETRERILAARRRLGDRLVILGHHYQRDEIVEHADFRGDSYKLAKDAAGTSAEYIVFCGVHFMAESADILTPDAQTVILPNMAAGCSMADMAGIFQVRTAWKQLESVLGDEISKVIPVTYINSAAALKAFVGERGGVVCTSTNAAKAVTWALERGNKVLFVPDQHLGRNTGVKLGFDPERDMVLWDQMQPFGGLDHDTIRKSKFFLWNGHCSVHKRFSVEQIEQARRERPDVKIVVHPECRMEVVQAADCAGSTGFIIKTVEESAPGSVWGIGTEINLVSRLAKEHPDKTIFCLDPDVCPCSTMYRIHPSFLLWVLDNLEAGHVVNQVKVKEAIRANARLALDRMLTVGG